MCVCLEKRRTSVSVKLRKFTQMMPKIATQIWHPTLKWRSLCAWRWLSCLFWIKTFTKLNKISNIEMMTTNLGHRFRTKKWHLLQTLIDYNCERISNLVLNMKTFKNQADGHIERCLKVEKDEIESSQLIFNSTKIMPESDNHGCVCVCV